MDASKIGPEDARIMKSVPNKSSQCDHRTIGIESTLRCGKCIVCGRTYDEIEKSPQKCKHEWIVLDGLIQCSCCGILKEKDLSYQSLENKALEEINEYLALSDGEKKLIKSHLQLAYEAGKAEEREKIIKLIDEEWEADGITNFEATIFYKGIKKKLQELIK